MDRKFTATVVRATGSWYDVLHDGETVRCRIRGRLRLKGVRSTNPVVVGDEVACEADEGGDYVIADILPRRNYVIRRASNLSKESHIIAANVDQALLMASLRSPETPTEFVDRFLVTCEAYKVPVTILLSKLDLQDAEAVAEFRAVYEGAGYRVLEVSVREGRGVEEVRELLAGRTTLVSGNSGVGKSTLIQAIDPSLDIRTGDLRKSPQGPPYDDIFDDVPPGRRRRGDRHAGHQGVRTDRHRRGRAVALFSRDDARCARLPLLQLHPHPRAGLCGDRSREGGRNRLAALRKLPENPR